jgi:hypothetical protein
MRLFLIIERSVATGDVMKNKSSKNIQLQTKDLSKNQMMPDLSHPP